MGISGPAVREGSSRERESGARDEFLMLFVEWRKSLPSERLNIGALGAAASEACLCSAFRRCSTRELRLTEATSNNLLLGGKLIVTAPFGFSYHFGQYIQGKYEFENTKTNHGHSPEIHVFVWEWDVFLGSRVGIAVGARAGGFRLCASPLLSQGLDVCSFLRVCFVYRYLLTSLR